MLEVMLSEIANLLASMRGNPKITISLVKEGFNNRVKLVARRERHSASISFFLKERKIEDFTAYSLYADTYVVRHTIETFVESWNNARYEN